LNIVKELIENSIDASSTEITVTIEKGGIESISVKDNGFGIDSTQVKLAFDLHTTSKLSSHNLETIPTLGFRGEALASISSISYVDVESKMSHNPKGKRLEFQGGKLISDETISCKDGTFIHVYNIFYNTPVRKKFLKTSVTERKRISDLIINYCLMYPKIHFQLIEKSNDDFQVRIESPKRNDMLSTIYDVLGPEIANQLMPLKKTIGHWKVSGYISKPSLIRSDRSLQFININGRPIRNQELQSTIEDVYGSQLMRKTYPAIILKLKGPYDAIDFNVHPQKSEIRFKTKDVLLSEIALNILKVLEDNAELSKIQSLKLDRIKNKSNSKISTNFSFSNSIQTSSKQEFNDFTNKTPNFPSSIDFPVPSSSIQTSLDDDYVYEDEEDHQILGHIMNKFGILQVENELWLVDIHAADERVKFEMYANGLERKVSSQQFLEPINIPLINSEAQILIDHKHILDKFGMKISKSVNDGILVHSMPIYYDQDISIKSITDMISDMLAHINDSSKDIGEIKTPLDRIELNIIQRLSCHGAIRSGYPVSKEKIRYVVSNLLKCSFPWTCAHGRPTVMRIDKNQLESLFYR